MDDRGGREVREGVMASFRRDDAGGEGVEEGAVAIHDRYRHVQKCLRAPNENHTTFLNELALQAIPVFTY